MECPPIFFGGAMTEGVSMKWINAMKERSRCEFRELAFAVALLALLLLASL
jgi:hypothetical protein